LPWVVGGGLALVVAFAVIFFATHSGGSSRAPGSYTPSEGTSSPAVGGAKASGGSNIAKLESLRFQITQLQEEEKQIERKIEDIDAEQSRESDKLRNSKTPGVDGIAEALKYKRESESRVRLKDLRQADLTKVRKQISEKKQELADLERGL
jgi:hypothetical protein